MNESVLQKYTGRRLEELTTEHELDGIDDGGPFGWLRGIRDRAAMLELRKKDGSILAINYGWLERADFDPSEGITLHLPGRSIRIRGRNLNTRTPGGQSLFQGITRHRIPWVREAVQSDFADSSDAHPIIESIE